MMSAVWINFSVVFVWVFKEDDSDLKVLVILSIYIAFIFWLYSCFKAAGDYDKDSEKHFKEMIKQDVGGEHE